MAKKKRITKRKSASSKAIQVKIDLGPVKASPEQVNRLKAFLENHVLTWVKSDLKGKTAPPIVAEEFLGPPPFGDDDSND
jgi:hypothetical protein